MSKLLSSLLTKEQLWAIHLCRSWQKSNCVQIALDFFKKRATSVIHSWYKWIAFKKGAILLKINIFLICFDSFSMFSPFFCPIANLSRRFTLSGSLVTFQKRVTVSKLPPLLFTKKLPWAVRSFSQMNRSLAKKTSNSYEKPMRKFPTLYFYESNSEK